MKVEEGVQGTKQWLYEQTQTLSKLPKYTYPPMTLRIIQDETKVSLGAVYLKKNWV